MKGHVSEMVGGVCSVAVEGDDEGRPAVDEVRWKHEDCAVSSSGVVDIVDLASGVLGEPGGPLKGGAVWE